MKGLKKRIVAFAIITVMVLTSFLSGIGPVIEAKAATTIAITEANGWLESAYVEWEPVSGAKRYDVYVSPASSSNFTRIDDELIRQYPGYWRADVVGLKAGSYVLKVVATLSSGTVETTTGTLTVLAHDRSGYGFVNGTSSGAYNEDGTLKSNAKVFYVTEETKSSLVSTIEAYVDGNYPLAVRIIGEITDFSGMDKGDLLIDNGGNKSGLTIEGIGEDATANGWGIRLKNSSNVEIRNLAVMNCDSSEGDNIGLQQKNDHVWVHNCDLFYGDAGSDADQVKGDGALDTKKSEYVTHSYNHFWDTGKSNLQGANASDTSNYITYHHNWYDHSDSRHPRVRVATVHVYNNYYDGNAKYGIGSTTGSDIFAEANYFRNCKYPIMISKQGTDALGEGTFSGEAGGMIKAYNNYIVGAESFISYQDNNSSFDAYVATSRNEKVPSSVKALSGGATYNNFDTASDFYSYTVQSPQDAKTTVEKYAGRINGGDFKWEFNDAVEDTNYDVIKELKSALVSYKTKLYSVGGSVDGTAPAPDEDPDEEEPSSGSGSGSGSESGGGTGSGSGGSVVEGSVVHNFTSNDTASDFYTINGNLSKSKGTVTYAGLTLTQCLKMESSTSISFKATSGGTLTLVFVEKSASKVVKVDGTTYASDANGIVTVDIAAGSHTISKADTSNLFYIVFATEGGSSSEHTHSYTGVVTKTATCISQGVKTYTCSCGDGYTEVIAMIAHTYSSSYTIDVEATDTVAGSKSRHCTTSGCTAKTDITVIPATGSGSGSEEEEPSTGGGSTTESSEGTAGGWNESIFAEFSGISDADVIGVSYSGTMTGTLTGDDLKYLVRDYGDGVRVDIPGLKAGTYTLTVTTKTKTIVKSNIKVEAYDRSGYAHFNYTAGVGAYNDDGTLKNNAKVIYVTNSNKNSVTVTSKDGTTVTGIGNILNSSGKDSGNGKTSKGGKPNTNQDIIKKLAQDGTPLVIRIVGNVTAPDGVTAYDSVDYGGSVGDNGYMVRMQSGKDITIEGIGADATINGWGIHFMAQSSDPNYGKSFEVRNIAFKNVPEDCIGMEGVQEGSTLTASVERCWIHHCSFYAPKISNPAESDKDGGDGACDFKRGQYFTNSYCYYESYHKTNLVGASDDNVQYHITYHHNYWKNCESRGPLLRQANVHMYNNVFDGQTSYCMNPRANGYIFSEYNIFDSCKNPMQIKSGAIKSYNDVFTNCKGDQDGTIVSSKSTKVSSSNKYASFELDSSVSYIPSGDYKLDTNVTKAEILATAGTQSGDGSTSTDPEEGEGSGSGSGGESGGESGSGSGGESGGESGSGSGGESGGESGGATADSYVHIFQTDGTTSGFFSFSTENTSDEKGTVTYNGKTYEICLKMQSATTVTFEAPTAGKLTLGFCSGCSGKSVYVDGTSYSLSSSQILTVDVAKGEHTVKKNSGESYLYYIVFTPDAPAHTHSYTSSVTKNATCIETGVKTFKCSCGDSYTETIAKTAHTYSTEWTIDVQATATTEGSKSHHCTTSGCTAKADVTVIPATGSTEKLNGFVKVNGVWSYYVDGVIDTSYTGIAENAYGQWYVKNGQLDRTYTGMVKDSSGVWWYVANGMVDTTYTGMAKNEYGWFYMTNGKLDRTYTGIAENAYGKWYIKAGCLDKTCTGMAKDAQGVWWYVVNGMVDETYTGIAENPYGKWYMKAGCLDRTYTGMAKDAQGVWWYVVNGMVDTTYTGIAENAYGRWYMKAGCLDRTYTGMVKDASGVWCYVANGMVDDTYTGMAKNEYGWFYMTNGQLDRTYTGIAKNAYGTWYMKNGTLQKEYSGTVTINGVTYRIQAGQVI